MDDLLLLKFAQLDKELSKYTHVAIHAAKGSASTQKLLSRLEQNFSLSHLSVQKILRHLTTQETPSISSLPAQIIPVPVNGWNEMMVGPDPKIRHMDQGHVDGLLGSSDTWDSFMEFSAFLPPPQHYEARTNPNVYGT